MGRERLALYSLVGPRAVENDLAGARWFKPTVARKRLKELMRRDDRPALRDTAIWLGAMVGCASAGAALWGSPAAAPFLLAHGVLYGSGGDSRWHECGHGTPFRTPWMNAVVYQLGSFMMMRDPTVWRWSHTRHHTDTLIVGRDPEIVAMRPARLARILANFFGLVDVPLAFRDMVIHASGRLHDEERTFIPESERPKVARNARIWLGVYAAVGATAAATGSWLPVVIVGGPRVYGTFMHVVYGLTQHAGMGEDVTDHRLNTRTVRMNRINRFLYWNMNYHVEHHLFPMVPYHRLPELHEEIKDELCPPYPSIWAAYRELVPAVLRQLKDQTYSVHRQLPESVS
jgi:fatty acid desaturase